MSGVDASHAVDTWHQYGFVPAGPDTTALVVGVTQRCSRCAMAVRIGAEVTPVGAMVCVGAPPAPRPT